MKDRYLDRFALYHVLSRQAQEIALFNGRLDGAKVQAFLDTLIPPDDIDAAFICGPSTMIDAVEAALLERGVPRERVHAERFGVPVGDATAAAKPRKHAAVAGDVALTVVLDGKSHEVPMAGDAKVLDSALSAGLDLPYACKGGVCCTCRAKVLEGRVEMDKNFTLEDWEIQQGFVLTCQARPLTQRVVVSYDER